jgi:(2Fe-2S) ferredoxin
MRILYNGRIIYRNLSHEQCAEILDELSEQIYNDKIDPAEIEVEED